jgi:hypothetical protein
MGSVMVTQGVGATRRAYRGLIAAASAILVLAAPASAQFSDSYRFLKGVRDRDGAAVEKMVDGSGGTVVNTRDLTTGESALHIVVKRRDATWLSFLLGKGARPDARDDQGTTPLLAAARIGFAEGVQLLLERGAKVNLGNSQGETALIAAVQNRDIPTIRVLLASGADPRQPDRIAGMSARDYAVRDPRAATVLKLLDDAKPARPSRAIAGPL